MRTQVRSWGVALGAVLMASLAAGPPPEPPTARALAALSADRLRAHVTALADDAMEGRGTGTAGYDRAAAYVAAQMRAIGLAPGVGGRSYFQPVPLARGDVREEDCRLVVSYDDVRAGSELVERPLRYGEDYLMSADLLRDSTTLAAPMVFVGYGVVAPELGHDDYAGVDVHGRVAVALAGAPDSFPSDQRAYYSWGPLKEREAAAHGARGLVSVRTPSEERRTPWDRAVRQSLLPALRWTDPAGIPHDTHPELEVVGTLARGGAEAVFDPMPFDSVLAGSGAAGLHNTPFHVLHARRVTARSRATSPNVVGVLRGSDRRLRDQWVVVSAHLDHLGISAPVRGDSINNGAYDNASGVAILLEVARALASQQPRPRRSIAFVAVTGEEKGLQGSDFFARFPTLPKGTLVADVNLDMVLMLAPLRDVVAFGAEHSSLGGVVRRAADRLGLAVSPDPNPEQVVFIRSDQFSFVRRGIPAVFPVGGRPADSTALAERTRWMHEVYHSPQDDLSQSFRWDEGVTFAKLALLMTLDIADAAQRPTWNAGDFFGATFGRKR